MGNTKLVFPSGILSCQVPGPYTQTDSIFLLLTAAWFSAMVAWNILEALLETLGMGTSAFERYVAAHPLQLPIVGLVVSVCSVAANFVIQSHWFPLSDRRRMPGD